MIHIHQMFAISLESYDKNTKQEGKKNKFTVAIYDTNNELGQQCLYLI